MDQSQAAGWIGFGMATLTFIGGVVKAILDARKDEKRDDKDNAIKIVKLEAVVERNEERAKRCEESHADTHDKLKKCEEDHKKNDNRLTFLEGAYSAMKGGRVPIDPDDIDPNQVQSSVPVKT